MKELIIEQMKEILYRISYAEYNENYSNEDYTYEKVFLEYTLSPLISLSKKLEIDLSGVKSSHCGHVVCADEYDNLEDKLKLL